MQFFMGKFWAIQPVLRWDGQSGGKFSENFIALGLKRAKQMTEKRAEKARGQKN